MHADDVGRGLFADADLSACRADRARQGFVRNAVKVSVGLSVGREVNESQG